MQESLDDPSIDGVVVVQGTDTIEETSFAWDLVLRSAKPVVVTGAMRAPHEADFDGPANLRDAVAAAVSPELRDAGVVVTLAGTLEPADDVTKLHTTAFTTFGSPNGGTLGRVADGRVVSERARGPRRRLEPVPTAGARVHLLTAGIGSDGSLLDAAVAAGADGIVVAATGAGNTSPGWLAAAERAMAAGVVVALASRCPAGPVSTAYALPGRRRDVGPRRRDPGRDAVRDQGPRGAGPRARRGDVARSAGGVARGPGRVGTADLGSRPNR